MSIQYLLVPTLWRWNAVVDAPASSCIPITQRWSVVGRVPTLERGNYKMPSRSHALRGNAVMACHAVQQRSINA